MGSVSAQDLIITNTAEVSFEFSISVAPTSFLKSASTSASGDDLTQQFLSRVCTVYPVKGSLASGQSRVVTFTFAPLLPETLDMVFFSQQCSKFSAF